MVTNNSGLYRKIKLLKNPNNMNELGMDSCEFFISTNLGEILQPLSKIASGGEISRIMLAIKMAFQSHDIVSTLIFDEIDTGISGSIAEKVGGIIEGLSQNHQILCITHLSQIASQASTHFKVKKNILDNRTVCSIDKMVYIRVNKYGLPKKHGGMNE